MAELPMDDKFEHGGTTVMDTSDAPTGQAVPAPIVLEDELHVLKSSGLFDLTYYLAVYPDIDSAVIPPLEHFFFYGYKEGRRPNPFFDPIWYLEHNPDVAEAGMQPLLHFVLHGDREGRDPGPLFCTQWYRDTYALPENEGALVHYLTNRANRLLSPIPDFDAEFYAKNNQDVVGAGVDIFEHFLNQGYKEYRNPSRNFDVKFYAHRHLRRELVQNPLLHFLAEGRARGLPTMLSPEEASISREIKRFTKPGPDFEPLRGLTGSPKLRAKVLAYYLPQFHTFAENDRWWGTGFTEWTNIARGSPRFVGHYQPRVPRDLGFYNLSDSSPMRRQIELAKQAGIHGFIFYFYWFNGKRLLDAPLERFVADRTLDMPFALMWANENWTRRWDGAEDEVLISQDYRADDDHAMVAAFAAHFRDPRYIRVGERPILMIYRAGLIPDTARTVSRWRSIFQSEWDEDPVFIMAQSFGATDPTSYGMDGAIEFPPHKLTSGLAPANSEFEYLDFDFTGLIYRYEDVVSVSLSEPPPSFPLIRTAVPSWDNDARRQGDGLVITGSTPAKYEAWLNHLVVEAESKPFFGEPLVCINAWNEWCEGAYLEPDLHFGAAYLNSTARAVSRQSGAVLVPRLVLVGHDAFPSGAQHLLLSLGCVLRQAFGVESEFLLLGGGVLLEQYEAVGSVTIVESDSQLAAKLGELARCGHMGAVINSAASGRVAHYAEAAGIRSVLLFHELPRLLREKNLVSTARTGLEHATRTVFAAASVRDAILAELGISHDERMLLLPQGSYAPVAYDQEAGAAFRAELGIGPADQLVIGVGYADLRKGFDLFLQLWRLLQAAERERRVCLVWVGSMDPSLQEWLRPEIMAAEAGGTFHLLGFRDDVSAPLSAADMFVLTSREDPFPTVVLEALAAGLPVCAFDRSGGIPDLLLQTGEGTVVPYCDVVALAKAIGTRLARPITETDRARRAGIVSEGFDFPRYASALLRLALPELPRISVAVSSYNYARYLSDRLESVFQQTHPVEEILVLDDASRDGSVEVARAAARAADRLVRIVANTENSGSVFAQWRRAADLARGDFLWIAEADDSSEPSFIAQLLPLMADDPSITVGFCDSRTIDTAGAPQWDSYKEYYATVEPDALRESGVFDAPEFARRFLATKNLILNVSAVIWRRDALLRALDACEPVLGTFRMAGDWRLYLQLLSESNTKLAYRAEPLNVHRRHGQSVTHTLGAERHLDEIARCHAFARDALKLDESAGCAQAKYLREVGAQLNGAAANNTSVKVARANGRTPRMGKRRQRHSP